MPGSLQMSRKSRVSSGDGLLDDSSGSGGGSRPGPNVKIVTTNGSSSGVSGSGQDLTQQAASDGPSWWAIHFAELLGAMLFTYVGGGAVSVTGVVENEAVNCTRAVTVAIVGMCDDTPTATRAHSHSHVPLPLHPPTATDPLSAVPSAWCAAALWCQTVSCFMR